MTQTLPTGDLITKSGLVIPEAAHLRYLAHARRRRRQRCKAALSSGTTVPFSPEQLRSDGWGLRQIVKLTGGLKHG